MAAFRARRRPWFAAAESPPRAEEVAIVLAAEPHVQWISVTRHTAAALPLALALATVGCGDKSPEATPPETQSPAQTQPSSETTPTVPSAPLPPPPQPMLWEAAGAFVWHEQDVSPEALGQELRDNGFGWVALLVNDGLSEDAVEDDWIARFRNASGLSAGGWGVLRTEPVEEAKLASSLITRDGLDFYIADAEAEYSYSGADGADPVRFQRSRQFVSAFRMLQPTLPAAISSYCRADQHDIDWGAWRSAGFAFLPQAYVNDFGAAASPGVCVRAAQPYFPASLVHPTVGMYPGVRRALSGMSYTQLLEGAGSVGFSVYLAETRMTADEWAAFGQAITQRGLAARPR